MKRCRGGLGGPQRQSCLCCDSEVGHSPLCHVTVFTRQSCTEHGVQSGVCLGVGGAVRDVGMSDGARPCGQRCSLQTHPANPWIIP